MDKELQKRLIIEIMKADERDGLYEESKIYTLYIKREDRLQPQQTITITEEELDGMLKGEKIKGYSYADIEMIVKNK